MVTIRTIIAMAAHYKWLIYQMDVKVVFLNDNLEEEAYVEQPPALVDLGLDTKVSRLKKAL